MGRAAAAGRKTQQKYSKNTAQTQQKRSRHVATMQQNTLKMQQNTAQCCKTQHFGCAFFREGARSLENENWIVAERSNMPRNLYRTQQSGPKLMQNAAKRRQINAERSKTAATRSFVLLRMILRMSTKTLRYAAKGAKIMQNSAKTVPNWCGTQQDGP